jgi:hypothetical protein
MIAASSANFKPNFYEGSFRAAPGRRLPVHAKRQSSRPAIRCLRSNRSPQKT